MRKTVIGIIIGIVVGATTCVVASNLIASQVTYQPKDTSWGVSNVEAAIDSLYVSKTSNNYSTEEKVVGTWIDGKPIYQKTITGLMSPSANGVDKTLLTLNDAETFVNLSGMIDNGVPVSTYSTTDYNVHIRADGKNIVMRANGWLNLPVIITIQYTKTTDQAS